jgi:hypothetical protein
VVARCFKERIVGGEAFAVDASMVMADAYRRRGVAKIEELDPSPAERSRSTSRFWTTRPLGRRRRAS